MIFVILVFALRLEIILKASKGEYVVRAILDSDLLAGQFYFDPAFSLKSHGKYFLSFLAHSLFLKA